jgi:nuclear transport factor 2 (NTF2) superfamily protein
VRFWYEYRDAAGNWFQAYGNQNWEFDPNGYMCVRHASTNDLPIKEGERIFLWQQGLRPDDHPGLTELGLYTN